MSTFAHFFPAIANVQCLGGSLSDLRFEILPMLPNVLKSYVLNRLATGEATRIPSLLY